MNPPNKNWRSLITLVISALAILYFLVQAISLAGLLLISAINSQIGTNENVVFGLLIWYSLLSGVVITPVFLYSLYDYREKPIPTWLDAKPPGFQKKLLWLILAVPVIIFMGWLAAGNGNLSVFILGLINILVAGIPVLWFYLVGQIGLKGGSQLRKWGTFGFSLTILPILVMVVEVLALVVLAGFAGLWIGYQTTVNPQLNADLLFMVNQISLYEGDLESITQLIKLYILQPSVLFWVLAIFSGIIPLIEEIMKPIAIWFLAGKKISPQEGFVSGLLCGAGFALMENLLYSQMAVTPDEWLFMSLGRIGAAVLHILVSGLVGWGLAKTWRDGKWGSLLVMVLSAVGLHGFWNMIALISGIFPLLMPNIEETPRLLILLNSPLILLFFAAVMGIFLINRNFSNESGNQISETEPSLEGEGIVDKLT